jgi:hypothetical protein
LQYSAPMDFLTDTLRFFSNLIRPFVPQIGMAIAATFFFVYGGNIHSVIRKSMQQHHFLIRLSLFTVICAFGYGAVTVYTAVILGKLLNGLGDVFLFPVVLTTFLCIGFLAERKKQM